MAPTKLRPKVWTTQELAKDAEASADRFRLERLDETLDVYTGFYDEYLKAARALIPELHEVVQWKPSEVAAAFDDEKVWRVLCYAAAPPISTDDLKTVSRSKLTPSRLAADKDEANRLRDVLVKLVDPRRFPWIENDREPTKAELESAAMATASMIAASKVAQGRRNDAMKRQEQGVKDLLVKLGYEQIPVRHISSYQLAPKPMKFMGETIFFEAQGDIIAGLPDGRTLVVECKVSNSAINSRKRLVNDTGGKATVWYRNAGTTSIVVTAVLSGVYNVSDLQIAQNDKDISIFWDHRPKDFSDFLKSLS